MPPFGLDSRRALYTAIVFRGLMESLGAIVLDEFPDQVAQMAWSWRKPRSAPELRSGQWWVISSDDTRPSSRRKQPPTARNSPDRFLDTTRA